MSGTERKLVVVFPGGRGEEIPLLYFGAKIFEDKGYEKLYVGHPANGEKEFEALYENAKSRLLAYDLAAYEDIVFVAKSIGTLVACKVKEELGISASLILFTPLQGTLEYMKAENGILLAAAGTKDRYLDYKVLREHCERVEIPCYIEENVGHRMEVMNDLARNLEIVGNVIGKLQECVEKGNE